MGPAHLHRLSPMLEFWFSGFVSLLQVDTIAFLILGMGIGLFVGVLPGTRWNHGARAAHTRYLWA